HRQLNSIAILDVGGSDLLSIGHQPNRSVGKNAVDVENESGDFSQLLLIVFHAVVFPECFLSVCDKFPASYHRFSIFVGVVRWFSYLPARPDQSAHCADLHEWLSERFPSSAEKEYRVQFRFGSAIQNFFPRDD